jgi:hypothetical protein
VTIELSFQEKKATGTMNMGGQARPIEAELGGPLFADGAGMSSVIAALPLADGYATTYRNFDVQKAKEKLVQLRVAGSESVTVPAGTFDAWKVEVEPVGEPGKMTIWIDKASRKSVKTSAVLAAMGGAVMTSELVP